MVPLDDRLNQEVLSNISGFHRHLAKKRTPTEDLNLITVPAAVNIQQDQHAGKGSGGQSTGNGERGQNADQGDASYNISYNIRVTKMDETPEEEENDQKVEDKE